MKTRSFRNIAFVGAAILGLGASFYPFGSALALGCSERTVKGSYAFTSKGSEFEFPQTTPTPVKTAEVSQVGIVRFDGNGNVTKLKAKGRFNGVLVNLEALGGHYTVEEDCTGNFEVLIKVTLPDGTLVEDPELRSSFFAVAGRPLGDEIYTLSTTLSDESDFTGIARKQTEHAEDIAD